MPNMSIPHGYNKISYRDFKISYHAKQRAAERIGLTKECDIQKLAKAAKFYGVEISLLNKDNYEKNNISYDMYRYLKNHYGKYSNTDKNYYYKDLVFVFAGYRSRSLKTIVPCSISDMELAIAKLNGSFVSNSTVEKNNILEEEE